MDNFKRESLLILPEERAFKNNSKGGNSGKIPLTMHKNEVRYIFPVLNAQPIESKFSLPKIDLFKQKAQSLTAKQRNISLLKKADKK